MPEQSVDVNATKRSVQSTSFHRSTDCRYGFAFPRHRPAATESRNLAVRRCPRLRSQPLIRRIVAPPRVGLFRLFGGRDLNLNGVNVVGLFGVHGHYSKTAIRAADLNGLGGLRSGRAWAHRVGS
jgi:hypothetical protein